MNQDFPTISVTEERPIVSACVGTVIWTENGFLPLPDILTVVEKLKRRLEKENFKIKLMQKLDFDSKREGELLVIIAPDKTLDLEHITITGFTNIKYNGILSDELETKIFICDRTKGMRAKILVISDFGFVGGATPEQASSDLVLIYSFQEELCKWIYEFIPVECDLGPIRYVSHITCLEAEERGLDQIIESTYYSDKNEFLVYSLDKNDNIPVTDTKVINKFVDYYLLLLSNQIKKIDAFSVDQLKDFMTNSIIQSKIQIPHPHAEIVVKSVNLEFNETGLFSENIPIKKPHRYISVLSSKRQSCHAVVIRLINNYLRIT